MQLEKGQKYWVSVGILGPLELEPNFIAMFEVTLFNHFPNDRVAEFYQTVKDIHVTYNYRCSKDSKYIRVSHGDSVGRIYLNKDEALKHQMRIVNSLERRIKKSSKGITAEIERLRKVNFKNLQRLNAIFTMKAKLKKTTA